MFDLTRGNIARKQILSGLLGADLIGFQVLPLLTVVIHVKF